MGHGLRVACRKPPVTAQASRGGPMPTTVRAMIAGKRDVYSVAPEATVFEALQ